LSLDRSLDGRLLSTAWTPGTYQLVAGFQKQTLRLTETPRTDVLGGAWELKFPEHSGAPAAILLPALIALNQHEDFGVRHFSGTATYRKTFKIEYAKAGKDRKLFLDLGRVNVVATVRVNGQEAGCLWKAPYRLPITDLVFAGENELEVDVTTLEQLPPENEYDSHGPIKQLPAWYIAGEPKPSQRVTFSCWHHYGTEDPLLQSGLTGPVTLIHAVAATIS
jgi:hypothetical protein